LFSNNTDVQAFLWNSFKQEYQRSYSAQEEPKKFVTFLENLKRIDQLNAEDTAVHGINKFSDMSPEEFASKFLLSVPPAGGSTAEVADITRPVDATAGLVDWTGKYTTPVKDQGSCGSCWAFSATEQIESDVMRTMSTTILLSPEQIVECDSTSYGCNGGWTENAYNYVKKAGGLESEADYPYTAGGGHASACHSQSSKYKVTVSGYTTIRGESNMASYTQSTGPLSVCVDASTWSSYRSGIKSSCGTSINHCVQAVGVDASSGGYWKVRNSWGTGWGESGYIRLAYGQNTCGITHDPTYASVGLK